MEASAVEKLFAENQKNQDGFL